MSRPQIGIDRLPARRTVEQTREAMNCKSCRKRKIKCNRLRPTCEACQIFACPCVYDAVPKKRGPKTDVLEALLKRVDGLEKRLKSEGKDEEANAPVTAVKEAILEAVRNSNAAEERQSDGLGENSVSNSPTNATPLKTECKVPPVLPNSSLLPSANYADVLLDTYFDRIHGKPYHIFDESSVRQRFSSGQLPEHLGFAIFAVSARYASNYGGYDAAVRTARKFARKARSGFDIDDPSIESLQTLMLLSLAMFQEGHGKKAYMYLCSAISMALALDLHLELSSNLRASPAEREGRRRIFWSCYLLDRFSACGSKRPSLISDESIVLRLPSGSLQSAALVGEGEFFSCSSSLQYMTGVGSTSQDSTGILVGIARILGNTNRYLATGGVKGDSHFPWNTLSTLSKIRQDLDLWAAETQDIFSSIDALFGHPDSVLLVLSKLIYHLIHCLIFRPFLPVDLAELSRSSQHQSWQIEATNLCFLHANATAELIEIGKVSSITDWPSFVSYCICTAGTIHVHGAHYRGREGEIFSMSPEFLSRELQQLTELCYVWAGIQHQKNTLQLLYGAHSELVRSLASNPMRFSPVFQMEDFFDRYPGYSFDGSHITLAGIPSVDNATSRSRSSTVYGKAIRNALPYSYSDQSVYPQPQTSTLSPSTPPQPSRKRRATGSPDGTARQTGLVPVTFNGVPSTDTYRSPYSTSSVHQHQNYSHFHPPLPTPPTPNFAFSDINGYQNENTVTANDSLHQQQQPAHLQRQPHESRAKAEQHAGTNQYDPMLSMPAQYDQENGGDTVAATPGTILIQGMSNNAVEGLGLRMSGQDEADPFLSLLEQLAENEQSRGGPSELDFFLGGS